VVGLVGKPCDRPWLVAGRPFGRRPKGRRSWSIPPCLAFALSPYRLVARLSTTCRLSPVVLPPCGPPPFTITMPPCGLSTLAYDRPPFANLSDAGLVACQPWLMAGKPGFRPSSRPFGLVRSLTTSTPTGLAWPTVGFQPSSGIQPLPDGQKPFPGLARGLPGWI